MNELIHATLSAVAPHLEGLFGELVASVLTDAGPPTAAGVQQVYDRAEWLAGWGNALDACSL